MVFLKEKIEDIYLSFWNDGSFSSLLLFNCRVSVHLKVSYFGSFFLITFLILVLVLIIPIVMILFITVFFNDDDDDDIDLRTFSR